MFACQEDGGEITEKCVLPGEGSADDQLLDLARALVQIRDARVAQVFADRVLIGVP